MKFQKYLALACTVNMMGAPLQAAPPTNITEALAAIQSDSVLLSGWTSEQFKRAIPFNSTAGNVVPSQIKLLGFEVGVQGVATSTKVDKDGLRNLGTTVIDTTQIDMFDRMPLPNILGHAKIGLPWGLDAGVRIGGIPTTDIDEDDTHGEVSNSIFGLDLRKALIEEGITRPFGLTLGLNYTRAKGHVAMTTLYDPNIGSNVTFSDDTGATSRTDWKTDSVGLQAILNKKILFFNPYIGAAVNRNYGTVDTSITSVGTVETVNGSTVDESFTTVGTGSSKPRKWDLRGMIGAEFSILPFLRLGIGGEIASENNLAANVGLRVQFR